MKVLVTGSSGLIGSALLAELERGGNSVHVLVRRESQRGPNAIFWNPASAILKTSDLEGFDAVVHLGGESLAAGRWTQSRIRSIRESRITSTQLLCRTLTKLSHPPRVLACASAIGFYGSRADEMLTEESAAGSGFLAELGVEWEEAAKSALDSGIRVVSLRFGLVLSSDGGALEKMLTPFRFCLGGPLGTGRQFWSWIAIEDAIRAICHTLETANLSGPVNIVSPQPVSNREFTKTLGSVLSRPAICAVPSAVLRVAMGRMADEALLSSARVKPERLIETGFEFRHPDLTGALEHLLKRESE